MGHPYGLMGNQGGDEGFQVFEIDPMNPHGGRSMGGGCPEQHPQGGEVYSYSFRSGGGDDGQGWSWSYSGPDGKRSGSGSGQPPPDMFGGGQ